MGNTYQNNKLVANKETEEVIASIEMVIKALGTMVIFPEYTSNPNEIGSSKYTGSIQQPILMGGDRQNAINKLNELISQL